MELISFIKELEKVMEGNRIKFSEEEKEFLFKEYYRTQGHYFPKSCGSCITGYRVLLNVARIEAKGKEVIPKKFIKDGFDIKKGEEKPKEIESKTEDWRIEDYQIAYKQKFGREVSNRYKNNIEWIKSKLG